MSVILTDGLAGLIEQALHLAKSLPFTDASIKIGPLSVNMDEILAELVTQCRF